MERLTTTTGLPAAVQVPDYERGKHGIGIVHFGLGAFHRAHMALYTDEVLAERGGDWCITGVSLRSPAVRDRLQPQNGLYSVLTRGEHQENLRIIGSVREVLVAPEDPELVFARLCDPGVRIVSMTITEKGYLRDPASGALLTEHPDIRHDLEHPDCPRTLHGFVVGALARRRQSGVSPLTLLSCDNLPQNGLALCQVIVAFAALRDPELAIWIKAHIAFPCTMVDRIVPATTPENMTRVEGLLQRHDAAPVVCEPFSQWVIEDHFAADRPAWDLFGVTLVEDVTPFEEMKLRLLNCSHSAIAYLGALDGLATVDQVIAQPVYLRFIQALMQEIVPTLQLATELNLDRYCAQLLERFRNPTLQHRTQQIAMDGSQKIPVRVLDTIRDRIRDGQPYPCLILTVAAWLRYIQGEDEQGRALPVHDPYAERLQAIATRYAEDPQGYVRAMVALEDIFGRDLATDTLFQTNLTIALTRLSHQGVRNTLAE